MDITLNKIISSAIFVNLKEVVYTFNIECFDEGDPLPQQIKCKKPRDYLGIFFVGHITVRHIKITACIFVIVAVAIRENEIFH